MLPETGGPSRQDTTTHDQLDQISYSAIQEPQLFQFLQERISFSNFSLFPPSYLSMDGKGLVFFYQSDTISCPACVSYEKPRLRLACS